LSELPEGGPEFDADVRGNVDGDDVVVVEEKFSVSLKTSSSKS